MRGGRNRMFSPRFTNADGLAGFRLSFLFFYSLEGSEPLHIHVEHGDSVATFWPDPVSPQNPMAFAPMN
jgi:hypothetical protein